MPGTVWRSPPDMEEGALRDHQSVWLGVVPVRAKGLRRRVPGSGGDIVWPWDQERGSLLPQGGEIDGPDALREQAPDARP